MNPSHNWAVIAHRSIIRSSVTLWTFWLCDDGVSGLIVSAQPLNLSNSSASKQSDVNDVRRTLISNAIVKRKIDLYAMSSLQYIQNAHESARNSDESQQKTKSPPPTSTTPPPQSTTSQQPSSVSQRVVASPTPVTTTATVTTSNSTASTATPSSSNVSTPSRHVRSSRSCCYRMF